VATGMGEHDPWEGDEDALTDHARASRILDRLGVVRAPITWSPVLGGGPVVAGAAELTRA
jgi:hypothetical protein